MGIYTRADSPFWWLYLETTKLRERTDIQLGATVTQKHDARALALARYYQRMNEIAARIYRLPSAQPAIRFAKYADTYVTDVIALRKGRRRDEENVKTLVAFFGADLVTAIDQERVRAFMRARRATVAAVTVNREVSVLKGMLRDAAPKYLSTSPLVNMRQLPILTPKRRLMSTSEERRLLAVCEDAQDRAILMLGIDTLLRLGDLLDLERADRAGKWLYVKDPKSGDGFSVALSPRAIRALNAIRAERYYFAKFRRAQNPRDWVRSVQKRLKLLCEKADLPYGRKTGGITFHWATRRTGATRMLMAKRVPLPVVQRLGNWKHPDVLLDIYAEAGKNDLLAAVGHKFTRHSRARRKRA